MTSLFVYADIDWLESPQLLGKLSFDSLWGSETYGFSYDNDWLAKYGGVFLGEDLQNFPGIQYSRPERDIFACFSDALPDRWGRALLKRREQISAAEEKRPVRRLTSVVYLMGIDDASCMGGFWFAETPGHRFINCEANLRVPPLANVRELMHAAQEIESSEERHLLPSKNGSPSYCTLAHRLVERGLKHQLLTRTAPWWSLSSLHVKMIMMSRCGSISATLWGVRSSWMSQKPEQFREKNIIFCCRSDLTAPGMAREYILAHGNKPV